MIKKRFLFFTAFLVFSVSVAHAVNTPYFENFDARQDDTTLNGVDSWSVTQGATTNAVTQSSVAFSGKSLKIANAATTVNISRPPTGGYGSVSPCWVEFVARPGMGAKARSLPTSGAGAVTFDFTGRIFAANGSSSWKDIGSFSADKWYRVIMKLDFSKHTYDVYVTPADKSLIPFVPAAKDLPFINTSLSSLKTVTYKGVYNASSGGISYVDDMLVHFVDRLQITTALQQTLGENEVSSPIMIQLQNSSSEAQTAWKDITLDLMTSSNTGSFSLDSKEWKSIREATITQGSNSTPAIYYKDSTKGQVTISAKETPDSGWTTALQTFTIVAKAQVFSVSASTPQIAGQDFKVQIVAKDKDGNTDTLYNGEIAVTAKYVTPSTGTLDLSPAVATGFKEGLLDLTVNYPDAGTIQIDVKDKSDSSKTGSSGQILFLPSRFGLSAANPQIVNQAFPLQVTAVNASGNVTPNYQGPVNLSVTWVDPLLTGGALTPDSMTSFDKGIAKANVTYSAWGRKVLLKAQDQVYAAQTGSSGEMEFRPASVKVQVTAPPSGRTFFYTGETVKATVSVLDALGQPIANYEGPVTITASPVLTGIPTQYTFAAADGGKKTFDMVGTNSGTFTVLAADAVYSLSAESPSFEVKQGILQVESTSSPVGTTQVNVYLLDDKGKKIQDSNITIQVILEEENPNGTAFSPGGDIRFVNGVAKVIVSDSEAETVNITPTSSLSFKIKKGTAKFGRIAKHGMLASMVRYEKD